MKTAARPLSLRPLLRLSAAARDRVAAASLVDGVVADLRGHLDGVDRAWGRLADADEQVARRVATDHVVAALRFYASDLRRLAARRRARRARNLWSVR